jgi:hypothetical protein
MKRNLKKRTRSYRVRWEIDVDAKSVDDAARITFEIMKDPKSIATIFEVIEAPVHVDITVVE